MDASLRNSGATLEHRPMTRHAGLSGQPLERLWSGGEPSLRAGLTAEGQQISDVNQAQGGQIANYLSLASGTPGATSSTGAAGNTTTGASTSAPNIMQAFENQYQGQLANYNSNVASSNTDIGAGASVAAAALIAL